MEKENMLVTSNFSSFHDYLQKAFFCGTSKFVIDL